MGTPVEVLSVEGDWVRVAVGGQRGFMMKRYLTFGQTGRALRLDTSVMPQLTGISEELLMVYSEPQSGSYTCHMNADGAFMKVIGIIGNEWYRVWFPATGEYGFVKQSDLWEGNG